MTNLQLFNKTHHKLPSVLFDKMLRNTENEVVKYFNRPEFMLFEDLEFIGTTKHNISTSQKEPTKIDSYHKDRVMGGKKRHAKTTIVKNKIIKPLFFSSKITGKPSVHNKANTIADMLVKIAFESDKELQANPQFIIRQILLQIC